MVSSVEDASVPRSANSVHEVVGVFDDLERLQDAVDALQEIGINRHDISTAADARRINRELSGGYLHVREIEDNGEVPRQIFISKVSLGDAEGLLIGVAVYIPAMIAAAAAAATGAAAMTIVLAAGIAGLLGGILGWMLARGLDRRYLRGFEEHLRRGGIVLWVAVHDAAHEERVREILAQYGGRDVHTHDLAIEKRPIPGWRGVSYEMSFMKRLRM
jgi:hypothetical protein